MSVPQPWTPESVATPEDMVAALHATDEGGADLVQLLTPEGERVRDERFDSYAADVGVAELQGLYRDMVLVRRFDREANALQRQGQLGIWVPLLGPGSRADRGRARARPPGHGVPVLPRARRGLVPRDRPHRAARDLPGHRPGRLGSRATRFHLYTIVIGNQCLNATGYAMGQQFEVQGGRAAPTPRPPCASSATAPRARATCTRASSGPRSTTRPSSSTARTTSGPSPSPPSGRPACRCTSAPGLRLPRHPRRRQRRARLPRRHPLGAGGVPQRQRAGARRGVHLPDGRAHHVRRPHPLPARRRAGAVEAQGPDRAGAGATSSASTASSRSSSTRSQAEADELAARFREFCMQMPAPAPDRMFSEVYAEESPQVAAQREEFLAYHASFEPEGSSRPRRGLR